MTTKNISLGVGAVLIAGIACAYYLFSPNESFAQQYLKSISVMHYRIVWSTSQSYSGNVDATEILIGPHLSQGVTEPGFMSAPDLRISSTTDADSGVAPQPGDQFSLAARGKGDRDCGVLVQAIRRDVDLKNDFTVGLSAWKLDSQDWNAVRSGSSDLLRIDVDCGGG